MHYNYVYDHTLIHKCILRSRKILLLSLNILLLIVAIQGSFVSPLIARGFLHYQSVLVACHGSYRVRVLGCLYSYRGTQAKKPLKFMGGLLIVNQMCMSRQRNLILIAVLARLKQGHFVSFYTKNQDSIVQQGLHAM